MSPRIRLGKLLILKVYCYSLQGYRSIHRSLQEGYWPAFRAYYDLNKKDDLDALVRELDRHIPRPQRDRMPPHATDLAQITPAPGFFRSLFGKWLGKGRRSWPISVEETRYLSFALGRLRTVLDLARPPDNDSLIGLRTDLCNCTGIIEARCYGLAELEHAKHIEHFDQTERVAHLRLDEIVNDLTSIPADTSRSRAAG